MKKPMIKYQKNFPRPSTSGFPETSQTILFYDQKLDQFLFFKKWAQQFKFKIALKAGESLKTLQSYQKVALKLQKFSLSKQTTFCAVGGGSIGDFVGFMAATFHRGKPLILIPSTWLSAVDSAHGGKNGLNLDSVKNQLGTFYPAKSIFLIQDLLSTQSIKNQEDGMAEVLKISLIQKPQIFKSFDIYKFDLWKNLPVVIDQKYRIIAKDPFETTGERQILNLGHTMGHVFESVHGLSHGQAVLLGLLFSARFSFYKGELSQKEFISICQKLFQFPICHKYPQYLKMKSTQVLKCLTSDKKKSGKDSIHFVLIQKIGTCIRKSILISDLMKEWQRQQKEL